MAIRWSELFQMIRDANRADYERRIKSGKTKRLPKELEDALFGFGNDMCLTLGCRIPIEEINAKADECKPDGMTREEFKEAVLNHRRDNARKASKA